MSPELPRAKGCNGTRKQALGAFIINTWLRVVQRSPEVVYNHAHRERRASEDEHSRPLCCSRPSNVGRWAYAPLRGRRKDVSVCCATPISTHVFERPGPPFADPQVSHLSYESLNQTAGWFRRHCKILFTLMTDDQKSLDNLWRTDVNLIPLCRYLRIRRSCPCVPYIRCSLMQASSSSASEVFVLQRGKSFLD